MALFQESDLQALISVPLISSGSADLHFMSRCLSFCPQHSRHQRYPSPGHVPLVRSWSSVLPRLRGGDCRRCNRWGCVISTCAPEALSCTCRRSRSGPAVWAPSVGLSLKAGVALGPRLPWSPGLLLPRVGCRRCGGWRRTGVFACPCVHHPVRSSTLQRRSVFACLVHPPAFPVSLLCRGPDFLCFRWSAWCFG